MKRLVLIMLSICSSAFANCCFFDGLYVKAFGGVNWEGPFKDENLELRLQYGYIFGGSVGYKVWRYLSLEAEGAYRSNDFDNLDFFEFQTNVYGTHRKTTAMGNIIADFPICDGILVPYAGLGLGGRWDKSHVRIDTIVVSPTERIVFTPFNSSQQGFAYQAIAGLIFRGGCPIEAAFEYRYLNGRHFNANHAVDLCLKFNY